MRIPKLALAGYLVGTFLVVAAFIRYTFVFDDPYKLAVFGGIGFCVLAVSYLYSFMKGTDKKFDELEKKIDERADMNEKRLNEITDYINGHSDFARKLKMRGTN